MFEDDWPDPRLVLFAAKLLAKGGRKGDAEAHLWRAFENGPTIELYEQLRKVAGKYGSERAIAFLEGKMDQGGAHPWLSLADLLIQIRIRERMFDAAWAAARKHKGIDEIEG